MYSFQDLLARKTGSKLHAPYQKFEPDDTVANLRANLIEEEAAELVDALKNGSLGDVLKETSDLLVVTLGTMATYGIDDKDLARAFELVNSNNMGKVEGGTLRDDGKLVKPPNYPKVDLRGLVNEIQARYSS